MTTEDYEVTGFRVKSGKPYFCFDCVSQEVLKCGRLDSVLLEPIHKSHKTHIPQHCERCGRSVETTLREFQQ